ncbi:hypothetical protein FI667_g14720, partial [Globisporangium splendens]
MNFAAERELAAAVAADHEPLAFMDFPTALKLDFVGLDMSPTHVDHHTQLLQQQPATTTTTATSSRARPAAPVSDADQRAKNRLIVKRCYYKKINTLNDLRSQMERIEAEYNALLAKRHEDAAKPTPAAALSPNTNGSPYTQTYRTAHDAYVHLMLVKNALQKENRELRRLEAQYLSMEKQMTQLFNAESKAITQAMQAHEYKRRHASVTIVPLTVDDCLEIASAAYQEILKFRQSKRLQSTGASILGWRDRYKCVENERLMFSLDKVFYGHTMDDLSRRTWEVLSNPRLLEKTYSPNVDVHFQIVQRVSEDSVVYYHTLERGQADMRIHALVLATRVDLGDGRGCMILFRGLDPNRYLRSETENGTRDRRGRTKLEPQKEKIWMDTFTWGIFESVGEFGEHCRDDYGGVVEGTKLVNAAWWMLETLMIALRCEAQVVGPQVVLTAS